VRAIMLMFDTLNRRYLPPYGATGIHAPNFTRLAERSVTFDTCYGGSMPCMPARREIHTGRHNFLHRSWGPLEPFDDSVPEMLSDAGVYTHLVTDHQHYWEDGGATYHNRYDSYEFFRGQEGDPWKGQVDDPVTPETVNWRTGSTARQDWVNRQYYPTIDQHPQTLTVDAGLEFVETNIDADDWFLQIECFDPHEPFVSYDEHRSRYVHDYDGAHFDWPDYKRVTETGPEVEHLRAEYSALLTMCDASLGRVLDEMDRRDLWDDTMLIVCTDHGLLLGERGWWGKNVQPWYDENIHTPLFIWDPRTRAAGERRDALVQTIDFGPTLLEYFGVEVPQLMQGRPLAGVLGEGTAVRDAGLFGMFGSHVNVTDGRHVYMRACADPGNSPLEEFTLMPTHMTSRFDPAELRDAELVGPLSFTKGAPVLRLPGTAWGSPWAFGTLLFDLEHDPEQREPLIDDELELRMADMLVEAMRAGDAPASQFERLGLPATGPVHAGHLLARKQRAQVEASTARLRPADEYERAGAGALTPVGELLADPATSPALLRTLPMLVNARFAERVGDQTPWRLAAITPGFTPSALDALHAELGEAARATV